MTKRKIKSGLYLVVDPGLQLDVLLTKITAAIEGGVSVVQVWNHWNEEQDKQAVVNAICAVAHAYNIPVLINEAWELLHTTALDGVHFDALPDNLNAIRQAIQRPLIMGITCGNDLTRIHWANDNGCDYISFCSMFPSASAGACEIVQRETVLQARAITGLPIFLAGGITASNLPQLAGTGFNGVALISAILHADDPQTAAAHFTTQLKELHTHEGITH